MELKPKGRVQNGFHELPDPGVYLYIHGICNHYYVEGIYPGFPMGVVVWGEWKPVKGGPAPAQLLRQEKVCVSQEWK